MNKEEAIKIVKSHYPANKQMLNEALEFLIPELKEDEDELTWLINYISEEAHCLSMDIRNKEDSIRVDKLQKSLAWLEKQGESKSYWKPTEEQYEALTYAYNICSDTERGNYYEGVLETLIEDLHRLDEQHPKFRVGDTIKQKSTGDIATISVVDLKNREYRLSNTGFIPFKYEHLWELVEQKPVEWSEEDKRIYQSIMDDTVQENQLDDKQTKWLSDIKYRYFPQPKQDKHDITERKCIKDIK